MKGKPTRAGAFALVLLKPGKGDPAGKEPALHP